MFPFCAYAEAVQDASGHADEILRGIGEILERTGVDVEATAAPAPVDEMAQPEVPRSDEQLRLLEQMHDLRHVDVDGLKAVSRATARALQWKRPLDAALEALGRLAVGAIVAGFVLFALATVAILIYAAYTWSAWALAPLAALLLVCGAVYRSRDSHL